MPRPSIHKSTIPEKIVFEREEIQRVVSTMDLFTLLEERRLEAQNQQDILHKRIGSLRDEIQKELGQSHKEIMKEIKEMKEEQRQHAREMSDRVGRLEQWKWQAAGAIAVILVVVPLIYQNINM
jgi:DNA-binding cell septation regulator SpoVG